MTKLQNVSPQTLRDVLQIQREEAEWYENQIRNLESKQYREMQDMQSAWDKCKNALHRELKRNEKLAEKASRVEILEKKVTAYEQRIEKIKAILEKSILHTLPQEKETGLPWWVTELMDAVGGVPYKGSEK